MVRARDARLIGKVRRGEDSAFEALHARYQPQILAFCAHLTGSREDAEDAVQHTFLACYRWIRGSDGPLELKPWLFTVARNRCLSLLRARHDDLAADTDLAGAALEGLSVEVERRQDLRDLVRDLQRLPEPQRAALVLSQLDALSYREIGTVLDVPAQKVKALVFQARSSLTSAREARDAPCFEIREEIATASGAARRRRLLRRHVGECEGCREFEVAVMRQRHDLGLLLPLVPSAALGRTVLEAVDRESAAAGAAAVGGGASTGLGGTLTAIGLPGVAKLAVVAAVVGGGASGALAADLPERVGGVVPWQAGNGAAHEDAGGLRAADGSAPLWKRPHRPGDSAVGDGEDRAGRGESRGADGDLAEDRVGGDDRTDAAEDERARGGQERAEAEDRPSADGGTGDSGHASLPPGLAKRDELPPGLAKRDGDLPPGLAKRHGWPAEKPADPVASQGNGKGAGQGGGQGRGAGGGQGAAGGQGNGGGDGNGAGSGNGNGGGQGNVGQGQGQSNGVGNGNGGGQSNGKGTGSGGGNGNAGGGGNPH